MSGLRIERFDRDCHRIVDASGSVMALILRLANEQWGLYGTDEASLTKRRFQRPSDALDHFSKMEGKA